MNKPGCPSKGFYRDLALKGLSACIATLPVPKDKTARDAVAAFLKENDDAAWLKYQLATMGMAGTKKKIEQDLTASVTGPAAWRVHRCSPLASSLWLRRLETRRRR